jgi:hypothetical protein
MRRRGIRGNEGTDEEEVYQKEQMRRRVIRGNEGTDEEEGFQMNEGKDEVHSIRGE